MPVTTKNAMLTSVDLFVDVTKIHVKLHFDYGDTVQVAGPYEATHDLLSDLVTLTGVRRVHEMKDKPCRVRLNEDRDEVVALGHFLREEWINLK